MNRQGQGQDPLLVHSLIRSRVLLRMAGVELWGSTRRHVKNWEGRIEKWARVLLSLIASKLNT